MLPSAFDGNCKGSHSGSPTLHSFTTCLADKSSLRKPEMSIPARVIPPPIKWKDLTCSPKKAAAKNTTKTGRKLKKPAVFPAPNFLIDISQSIGASNEPPSPAYNTIAAFDKFICVFSSFSSIDSVGTPVSSKNPLSSGLNRLLHMLHAYVKSIVKCCLLKKYLITV